MYGDESRFDSLRGGPESGYRISPYVGPLSALAYNRGLASESGRGYQSSPPGFAASALTGALRARGVRVAGAPRAKTTPSGTEELAAVESPTMTRLAAITNKPSDNFFAEMLLKDLALVHGPARHHRRRGEPGRALRRAPGRPPRPAGRRLGALARQPRHARTRRGPAEGDAAPRRVRGVLRVALDRRARRHAGPADAQRARARATAGARPARCRTSPRCRATAARCRATPTCSRS